MTEQELSQATARPGHIPESAVFDFDMFRDPDYHNDPHGRILDLLDEAPPVFWTPRNGGHWIALSYEANYNAARNPELFSSEVVPHAKLKLFMAFEKLLSILHLKRRTPMPSPAYEISTTASVRFLTEKCKSARAAIPQLSHRTD